MVHVYNINKSNFEDKSLSVFVYEDPQAQREPGDTRKIPS